MLFAYQDLQRAQRHARFPKATLRVLAEPAHQHESALDDAQDWVIGLAARQFGLMPFMRAAIITKYEDFAQCNGSTGTGPSIIWIRLLNTRRKELLAWFEKVLPMILAALKCGETMIEAAPMATLLKYLHHNPFLSSARLKRRHVHTQ